MKLLPHIVLCSVLCIGCSSGSKAPNIPQHTYIKQKNLGIGDSPTPPKNLKIPGKKSRKILKQQENKRLPFRDLKSNAPKVPKNESDPVSIMSSSGGVLTLWALKEGNWVWGYPPLDAHEFGEALFWRVVSFENHQVMIKNIAQGTCLEAYRNGVIHSQCNQKASTQFWTFNFFDNQAVQIQNVATKTCLQTPTFRHTTYYSIFLTQCAINMPNLDQQWYMVPIINPAPVIFSTN